MSVLAVAALTVSFFTQAQPWCATMRVTGYVRPDFGPNARTYDGTSIMTEEPIAAAGFEIPLGSMVVVRDAGIFRVADRGRLGPNHIDIAVWSREEAYALTSHREVCVFPPGF